MRKRRGANWSAAQARQSAHMLWKELLVMPKARVRQAPSQPPNTPPRLAMEVTKPSAVLHLSRYEDWCEQFGDHRH